MDAEVSKNNEQVSESPAMTLASEKPFDEHIKDVEKQKWEQEWKNEIKEEASEYEITEYDRSLLRSIDNIKDEHDKELALIGFSFPFSSFKDKSRKRSGYDGIEQLAIEYANRGDKDASIADYFGEKYGDNLYDFANEPSRTRGIIALEDAERYLSVPEEERENDGEFLFIADSLEFSKQVLARSKGE